jgi:hypothetical protein
MDGDSDDHDDGNGNEILTMALDYVMTTMMVV